MAEALLSTTKGIKPITKTPLSRDAFIDPTTGAERPINNAVTNPQNYTRDVATGQANAVVNRQIDSIAKDTTLTPAQKQVQMSALQSTKSQVVGITPEMRSQYTAEMNLPQNQYTGPKRDFNKENKMVAQTGGQPQSASEFGKMLVATYGASNLNQMGAQVGAGGTIKVFDPEKLKAAGFSAEQIASLQGTQDAPGAGVVANAAQADLNATPKPTNATLGVLQTALKAMSGVGKQEIGKSQLYDQAGIATTGALGYGALANAMQQRRAEMGQTYDSYANTIQQVGGQMSDYYNQVLEAYKATTDRYDKQVAQLDKTNQEERDYARQLDLMKKQAELNKETWTYQKEYEAKLAANSPDYQFVPETENQAAGYFNKSTGEFTPLTVGGDSYTNGGGSSYLGSSVTPNNGAYNYSEPVPHGAVNTNVVSANPNLIDIYKNGFQKAAGPNGMGGQCAYEAQQWVDFNGKGWKVGNTIQEKAKSFANYAGQGLAFYKGQGQPQVGNAVFSNDDPKYGHYWVINAITDDGKLVASEFNRAGSRVFSNNRIVDPNDKSIIGFLKTTPKTKYQVDAENTAAANISKAAQGIQNIAKGKIQGGLLDLAASATMIAKDYLVDSGKTMKASADQKAALAKVQEGIKAGILDENGRPFSPDRLAVRSGAMPDTMLNAKYTQLQKAVKKGAEPQEALDAFQQDLIYGEQKSQEIALKQKQDEKFSQPMNEGQSKAIGFAVSAQQAEGFMPKNGTDKSIAGLNNWYNRAGKDDDIVSDKLNEIKDPVAQQVVQTEMQWVANVLRGESGMAISLGEYKSAGLTYFPRPGDSATVLERKKAAREQKVQNLLVQGGPQGAQYWQNLGYDLPNAIAKQYGIEKQPSKDSLGIFGEGDSLGLGI